MVWIFTEGDGIESRLPFKLFSILKYEFIFAEGDESQSNSRKSSKEETMHDNDNASFQTFGVQMDSNPGPQGFVGVLQEEKRKRSKKEQREFNFMAPQNL